MAREDKPAPKAVLIDDESLLVRIDRIRRGRKDNTCGKTMKDLLREVVTMLELNGDRIVEPETSAA